MRKKLFFIITFLLIITGLFTSCQSTGMTPVNPKEKIDFDGMGFAYYQNGQHLNYETVRLEMLRNPRTRSIQHEVSKWENNVGLQVICSVLWPTLPLYVGRDTALRKESVKAWNESIDMGDIVVPVKSWEEAGFTRGPAQ